MNVVGHTLFRVLLDIGVQENIEERTGGVTFNTDYSPLLVCV